MTVSMSYAAPFLIPSLYQFRGGAQSRGSGITPTPNSPWEDRSGDGHAVNLLYVRARFGQDQKRTHAK